MPANSNENRNQIEGDLDDQLCDCTSFFYFSLSILLFVTGIIVTFLALRDTNDHYVNSSLPNFGHMWLVGPLLITSGFMVAMKTLIYLRRKTVFTFVMRQNTLFNVSIA